MSRIRNDIDAIKQHAARGWFNKSSYDVHEGGLARAVGTKQSIHAFADIKVDAAQRAHRTRVNLDEAANGEWSVWHGR